MTSKLIGEFHSNSDEREHLSVVFSKGSSPIKHRWRNNGLTADFVANYASTFLTPQKFEQIREIKDTVSYVANELLENGLKYHNATDDDAAGLSLRCEIHDGGVILTVSNRVTTAGAATLEALAKELLVRDASELYFEKIERSNGDSAGLGLITMVHDYEAQLAWRLTPHESGSITVSTQAFISLPQAC